MYRGHTSAVVIPAYNEEGFVADTIRTVPPFVDRIYVVDDGSTDDTWVEIERAAAAAEGETDAPFDSRVVAIQHAQNRGVGGAIKTGYLRAREDGVQLTAVMGGDGQMDPDILGRLFDPIVDGQADYTKGNRFLGRTSHGDMPTHRFVGNAVLGALTKIASGYWTSGDPQSGYTAISLHALETADVEAMYEFYGYCNDLLVKLNVANLRVVDVPSPIIYGDEESHIRYRSYIPRVSAMLFRNFLWRLKTNYMQFDFHPLVGAYAAGAIASVAAVAGAIWALPGVGSAGTPTARGAVALGFGLVAMLSFVWAMMMDKEANAHLDDAVHPGENRPATGERATPSAIRNEHAARSRNGAAEGVVEPSTDGGQRGTLRERSDGESRNSDRASERSDRASESSDTASE